MAIKVMAMNVQGCLNEHVGIQQLTDLVVDQQPDIAFFSEARYENNDQFAETAQQSLAENGFEVIAAPYNDKDSRTDRRILLGIHCPETVPEVTAQTVRFGERNALQYTLAGQGDDRSTTITGVHFNDRNANLRDSEITAYLSSIRADESQVLLGDYNADYDRWRDANWRLHTPKQVRLARALGKLVRYKLLPVKEPHAGKNRMSPGRIGSLASRLSASTDGTSMRLLTASGFIDADLARQPTFPSHKPFTQYDHIMVRGVRVDSFERLKPSFSDHLGIVAQISTR